MPQYRRLQKSSLPLRLWLALLLGFASPAYAQSGEGSQPGSLTSGEAPPEKVTPAVAAGDSSPSSALASEKAADVRLLIDVSGSMKSNDPANLRRPAIDLLVKLLPEGSKAGVWSFGRYVNMLVPHQLVGDSWKETASDKAQEINSTGLFTNIGLALEKASYDREQDPGSFDRHLILLTDGMVDIAKNPDTNQLEWQRIANDLLPRLRLAGYSIHTIALSDKADLELLQQLSRETDGHSAVAHSADQLMQAFLQAFDKAAPAEQLPFDGESFLVDSSVEEFTALIFSAEPKQATTLIAPDGSRYNEKRLDSSVNWFAGDGYDLVTVQHPFEGEWQVNANVADNSRITVVSDLSLKVKPLPNNISPGDVIDLLFSLRQEGNTISDPEFLSLLDINAQLIQQGEGRKQWNYKLYSAGDPTPEQGVFQHQLEDLDAQGQYVLRLEVDGKSFQRSFSHRFNSQAAFQAKLMEGESDDGQQGYWLTVSGATQALNLESTTVEVNLIEQDGNQRPFTMELGERNNWELFLPTMADGLYQFEMVVSGEYATGEHLRYNLPPLSLVLNGDSLVISDEPVVAKAAPAVANDDSEALDEAPTEKASSHNWLLYGLLVLGNVLVIALIYIGYRVFIMEKTEEDDEEEDEDEFIDVNAVVDDSELPVEEAIAEVKEAITPKPEEAVITEEAPAQEPPVEEAEQAPAVAEAEEAPPAPEDVPEVQEAPAEDKTVAPDSVDNDMGDPDEANIGDDVLAMDDMDDEDAGLEPPILDQAVEEPPVLDQAVEEPPAEPETKAAPNIDEEIDALLEQSNQSSQDDEDWAAALQDELDDADGVAQDDPAEEAAADLSESLDLADEAVADADLGELGGKKNADQG